MYIYGQRVETSEGEKIKKRRGKAEKRDIGEFKEN